MLASLYIENSQNYIHICCCQEHTNMNDLNLCSTNIGRNLLTSNRNINMILYYIHIVK